MTNCLRDEDRDDHIYHMDIVVFLFLSVKHIEQFQQNLSVILLEQDRYFEDMKISCTEFITVIFYIKVTEYG